MKLTLLFLVVAVAVTPALRSRAEPSASTAAAGAREKWVFVDGDDGIHVWRNDADAERVPGFRGQTHIRASIDEILEQMLDWKRHTEWMYGCEESALLKTLEPNHVIMYNRVGAPWPVWDRDVILDTKLERTPDKKHLKVSFQNVQSSLRPVPKRVIRLPQLAGFYKLWELEPTKTKILYQIQADLGGSVPRWIAIAGARDLPHITLKQLRERVESQKNKKKS